MLNFLKSVVFSVKSSKIEMEKTFFKLWINCVEQPINERGNII